MAKAKLASTSATTTAVQTSAPPSITPKVSFNSAAPLVRELPLDSIRISATNPRKTFDNEALVELAASIRDRGVLQPILVRNLYEDGSFFVGYELVAGERRFRASGLAGVETIPAIVRDLSDRESMEIQVIENLQRADLGAVEEARGFKALIDQHGYTADTLAERLGKSKSHVYGSLKLCDLPERACAALASGVLSRSTAQLIGRIPSAELRERAARCIVWSDSGEGAYNFRQAKELIERDYMKQLKGAPFSTKDATLFPEAGACVTCPKMTGNAREEYPDGRADMCTDPACFAVKVERIHARKLEEARDAGHTVLDEQKSRDIFNYGSNMSWKARDVYVELNSKCEADAAGRTYKTLIGDTLKPAQVIVAAERNGKLHSLVKKADAAKLLQKAGVVEAVETIVSSSPMRAKTPEEIEAEREEAISERVQETAVALVVERISKRLEFADVLRLAINEMFDYLGYGEATSLAKRRELIERDAPWNAGGEALRELVAGGDETLLIGVLAELLLWSTDASDIADEESAAHRLLTMCELDYARIEREVRVEAEAAIETVAEEAA